MADSTGFFGGLSTGLGEAQTQALAEQKQKALEENQTKTQAVAQVDETIKHIQEVIKANADAGNDPQKVVPALQPLIASAEGLAKAAGMDAGRVSATVQALLARPAVADSTKHSVVQIGEDNNGLGGSIKKYGVLEQTSGKVTPLSNGQPVLSDAETITPGQAQRANPTMSAAPVQPSSVAAAPDGTPAQAVAARFPGPSDQGVIPPTAPAPQGPTLPPTMQPGADAINYSIKNNITGPEFMKAIPPQMRNTVEGITDYKVDPDKLSKRVDKSGQSEYTRMLSFAHQRDPNYDPKYYKPMQKAITEFTSGGAQSPAGKITAGNTAIAHIGDLADAYDKMQAVPGLLDKIAKSNTSIASYAASRLKNAAVRGTSEGAALASFLDARERYSSEIENYYAGGKGADAAIQRSITAIDAAYSAPEMYSVLNTEGHLLSGKVGALQDRWKTSQAGPRFGDALFRNAIPDFPILSSKSEQTLDRLSQGFMAVKFKGANPAAGAPVDYRTYFGNQ